ncbi:hypothetical protein BKN38_05990 [Helicobacter sp. CLO-3]|nr:hypothetical protein BA723_05380 [Helicobacter sp. CLO-3]OHU83085.1 hypothetical protein BKN38_05990 [Helicobacter sp. CLO-3]
MIFEEGSVEEWHAFIIKNQALLQGFVLYFGAVDNGGAGGAGAGGADNDNKKAQLAQLESLCASLNLAYIIGTLPAQKDRKEIDLNGLDFALESKNADSSAESNAKPESKNAASNASAQNTAPKALDSSAKSPFAGNLAESIINKTIANATQNADKIIYKVRSGEEIISQGNVIIIGDVANGARVVAKNAVILGDCSGSVEIAGEFIILKKLRAGYLKIGDEVLGKEMIDLINASEHLNIVAKNSDNILIKEIHL